MPRGVGSGCWRPGVSEIVGVLLSLPSALGSKARFASVVARELRHPVL